MPELFTTSPAFLRWLSIGAFLITQAFAAIIFFIIRYHFRSFAAPGDERSRLIIRFLGAGLIVIAAVGAWYLLRITVDL